MALTQVKLDATEARVSAMSLPAGPGWLSEAREDALARLRAMGLPGRRDEYWKYTRPDTLANPEVTPAALFSADEATVFNDVDRLRIVFVDGVFDAEASDDLEAEGIEISRLADIDADIHWA